ncbi:MAG: LamG domain-containing protein [Candidatus Pacebacteria bacterium]|nr:LamG domain-containing protein [Candidatus Paceibacterota bacterium]
MNKSFTLIEILVVIVVIGVLSAFILVGMSSITSSANIAKSQAFVNSMDNSLLLGRVSEWKLDVNNVPAANQTPDAWGVNTGTLGDGSTATTFPTLQESGCISGKCFSFDGSTDYVDCGNGSNLSFGSGNFTVSLWVKSSVFSGPHVISKRSGVGYWFYASLGGTYFYIKDASSANIGAGVSRSIYDGTWHNLIGIRNNPNLYFYLDGIQMGGPVDVSSIGSLNVVSNLIFGMQTTYYWAGSIDDVRMYNTAIPISEIQQDYYTGLNKLLINSSIYVEEFNQRMSELSGSLADN